MGWKENKLIKERLKNLDANTERLFRINAGMAWTAEKKNTIIKRDKTGQTVILKKARPFHGAPPGWADLAGWQTITITPEMVGQKIAVFVFEECKATGVLSKIQKNFRDLLVSMGGVFRVLR